MNPPGGAYQNSTPIVNHAKLTTLTSGQCDKLQGCDKSVCQDLFRNGVYPRPMTYANVPAEQRLVPPSFSKVYPNGYFPRLASPIWGTECQVDPVGFYQGDLEELKPAYVHVEKGALPYFDPFAVPGKFSEAYKTQWPIAQSRGRVGLHDWGMQSGNYTFFGQ